MGTRINPKDNDGEVGTPRDHRDPFMALGVAPGCAKWAHSSLGKLRWDRLWVSPGGELGWGCGKDPRSLWALWSRLEWILPWM